MIPLEQKSLMEIFIHTLFDLGKNGNSFTSDDLSSSLDKNGVVIRDEKIMTELLQKTPWISCEAGKYKYDVASAVNEAFLWWKVQ
jgi:hypothetical protein